MSAPPSALPSAPPPGLHALLSRLPEPAARRVADLFARALADRWPADRLAYLCNAIPVSLDLGHHTVWYSHEPPDPPVRHENPAVTIEVTPAHITLTGPNSRWRAHRDPEQYPVMAPSARGNGTAPDDQPAPEPPPPGDAWLRLHGPTPGPTIGCTPWGAYALSLGWPEAEVYEQERALGPAEVPGVSPERIAVRNPHTGARRVTERADARVWDPDARPTYTPEPPPAQIVTLELCDCVGRMRLGVGQHQRSCDLWSPAPRTPRPVTPAAAPTTPARPAPAPAPAPQLDLSAQAEPWPVAVVILDTETTGIARDARIVEIAAARIDTSAGPADPSAWTVTGTFVALVNPGIPIPRAASAVNHIYDRDVAGAPDAAAVLAELLAWLPAGAPILAHNAAFDAARVEYELARNKLAPREPLRFHCTLFGARKRWPEAPNHKLGTLSAYLRLPTTPTHRALADVLANVELLRAMVTAPEYVRPGTALPNCITALCGQARIVAPSSSPTALWSP